MDREDPALYNALRRYIPYAGSGSEENARKIGCQLESSVPDELLVRSGRLPRTVLQSKMTLPNGETYYVDKKEELYITWQKSLISPKQKQALARLETARGELERRLKQDARRPAGAKEACRHSGVHRKGAVSQRDDV